MNGDLKPLEITFKSWLPIFIPIISIIFIAGTYFTIVKDTAAQVRENKDCINLVDDNSKERDIQITKVLNERIDKNQQVIVGDITILKENQARLIARQEIVLDTLKDIKKKVTE